MVSQNNVRENISIAFHMSNYATPYGDSQIPGNHPGHRLKRLGRQFAPDPINGDALRSDLHAIDTGICQYRQVAQTDQNNVKNLMLSRGAHNPNYVLDSVRGGRRHFGELRGKEQHACGRRALGPPPGAEASVAVCGRAPGVYNYNRNGALVDAMFEGRERRSRLEKAGKAMVGRPLDHNPLYLGFFYAPSGEPTHKTRAASETAPPAEPTPPAEVVCTPAVEAEAELDADIQPLPPVVIGTAGIKAPIYPTTKASDQMRGGFMTLVRNDGQHFARRRQNELKASRLEEIQLVEKLPKVVTRN
uniref:Uncharacterized protein n=1 Tax=Trypanosoma congolense (strain IL3000) TaxID=1068625 RepID=G0V030_TRYCI|nr:conserved hypothetical protein [Trypanosoma congolense IL3000]